VSLPCQSSQIFAFLFIFPYKMPKNVAYLLVTSLQPRGQHCRMLPVIPCGSGRLRGMRFASGVFPRRLIEER